MAMPEEYYSQNGGPIPSNGLNFSIKTHDIQNLLFNKILSSGIKEQNISDPSNHYLSNYPSFVDNSSLASYILNANMNSNPVNNYSIYEKGNRSSMNNENHDNDHERAKSFPANEPGNSPANKILHTIGQEHNSFPRLESSDTRENVSPYVNAQLKLEQQSYHKSSSTAEQNFVKDEISDSPSSQGTEKKTINVKRESDLLEAPNIDMNSEQSMSGGCEYEPKISNCRVQPNEGEISRSVKDSLVVDCPICHLQVPTFEFNHHIATHDNRACQSCSFIAETQDLLDEHRMTCNTNPSTDDGQPTTKKKTKIKRHCKECRLEFATDEEMYNHKRTHIPKDKLLECKFCPFVAELKTPLRLPRQKSYRQ